MRIKRYLYLFFVIVAPLLLLAACDGHDEPEDPDGPTDVRGDSDARRTVLVYAVASNNLSSDLVSDKAEMLDGLRNVDLKKYNWLVYNVINADNIELLRAVKDEMTGEPSFETVRKYDNEILSTDPKRMREVIKYAYEAFPAEEYGLIFWAHGSAWSYGNNNHVEDDDEEGQPSDGTTSVPEIIAPIAAYAYGGDQTTGVTDWTNIDELASAIPDGKLEFIWFDNCYMSSIEVMYQIRKKAHWFIGYPTEIYAPGSPYDETIPLLLQDSPDYVAAAKACFDWYDKDSYAVTMCVADLTKIEPLAEQCRLAQTNFKPVSVSGLMKYSRGTLGPYYDLGQYMRRVAENEGSLFDQEAFGRAYDDFVVYKAHSARNFSGQIIDPANYSGINVHAYDVSDKENDEYYRTLDWYIRTFE